MKNILEGFDNTRQIAIIWDIEDVQNIRNDLTDEQAYEVLLSVKDGHDADMGVSWETLRIHAEEMFPEDGKETEGGDE